MTLADDAAVVLFSGGQDSTTCLAWALDRFARVHTVAFDYRQRHTIELACRGAVIAALRERFPAWAARLGEDRLIDLGVLSRLGETALTADVEIAETNGGLPTTFVPGRNLLFLSVAAIVAGRHRARHIVGGMCETDYSGYPDCRDDTMKAMQLALNHGMDAAFVIHTPLMWRDKAATWRLAEDLGGAPLVELIVEHTHTCYRGDRRLRHAWGYGCDACPACALRRGGYERFVAGGGGVGGGRE
ncbi:MAG: 7-cyano-7-deazaguanine synthase QueC [Rhodospirillales bacterium]